MLLEQRIKDLHNISASEDAIGKYLLSQKYKIKAMSTRDIAKATFTSSSTIVRFAKRLGYSGFNELKDDYLSELRYLDTHFKAIDANLPFNAKDSLTKIAGKLNVLIKETMDDTLTLVDHDQLQRAILLINRTKIIHLFGLSASLLFAERFKYQMTRINKFVEVETLVGEYGFNINLVHHDDCAILISYSGESASIINNARLLKERNIPLIVITSLGDNSLKQYADIVLHLSTREKQYSKIANFSSEYSIQYLLDLLYAGYFSLNYEKNLNHKINLAKTIEQCRNPQLDPIKEK